MLRARLFIESLSPLGDGIAQREGKTIYVPLTAPGDEVTAEWDEAQPASRIHARLLEITTPSPDRRHAPCTYYGACGGCSLQHLSAESYVIQKQKMLTATLARAGVTSQEIAPLARVPEASRRRVELHYIPDTPAAWGFLAHASHRQVPVQHCLIATPALQETISKLYALAGEYPAIPYLTSVQLTDIESKIDACFHLEESPDTTTRSVLENWARQCGFSRAHAAHGNTHVKLLGDVLRLEMAGCNVPLPPEYFLQATAAGERYLVEEVLRGLSKIKKPVLDLFCGLGTFALPISGRANVHAIEGDKAMTTALSQTAAAMPSRKITAETRDLFTEPLPPEALNRYAAIVINPPRAGAKLQTEQIARSRVNRVVMVSCNPATFVRDVTTLCRAGFVLTRLLPVDQFRYSAHLEVVATLQRKL